MSKPMSSTMSKPMFKSLSGLILFAAFGTSAALAAPPLPQSNGPAPTTDWHLERGTEDGVDYVAVMASNAGTDIALQLVCTVESSADVTLFGEPGAAPEAEEAATVTTRVAGQPARTNQWQQSLEEGDVRTFDLTGTDAYDLITTLSRVAAGDLRFEVSLGRLVHRYAFDLSKGAEERSMLAAACASWRSGSSL